MCPDVLCPLIYLAGSYCIYITYSSHLITLSHAKLIQKRACQLLAKQHRDTRRATATRDGRSRSHSTEICSESCETRFWFTNLCLKIAVELLVSTKVAHKSTPSVAMFQKRRWHDESAWSTGLSSGNRQVAPCDCYPTVMNVDMWC